MELLILLLVIIIYWISLEEFSTRYSKLFKQALQIIFFLISLNKNATFPYECILSYTLQNSIGIESLNCISAAQPS